MKILNLYAGLGGNRKLWPQAEITAIEKDAKIAQAYKNNFPQDTVIVTDAHLYLLQNYDKYDFIWSSPPCQTHSKMNKGTRHKRRSFPDLSLYQEIIFLEHFYKGKWIVENVIPYYKPLIEPTARIGRHLFWGNVPIDTTEHKTVHNFMNLATVQESTKLKEYYGLPYEGNLYYQGNHDPCQVLRNCIHPEIGLQILNVAIQDIKNPLNSSAYSHH